MIFVENLMMLLFCEIIFISIFCFFHFLCSFDARSSDIEKGSHWLDEKSLGGRAYFQASETPSTLIIDGAQDSDSGIYRCRVDFHKSPTRNSRVQLKIICKYLNAICTIFCWFLSINERRKMLYNHQFN